MSRSRALAAALVAALILGCASPPAEPDPDAPVLLHFDWPGGMTAEVELREWSAREAGRDRTLRFALAVGKARGGRRVDLQNARILEPVTREQAVRALAPLGPSFVVGDDGQVLRVVDVEEHRARMLALLGPAAPPSADEAGEGDAPQVEAPAWLEATVAEDALLEAVRDLWSPLVGAWAEVEMVPDVVYQDVDDGEVPLFGTLRVPLATEYGIGPPGPCGPEVDGPRCVEVTYRARPDPERWDIFLDGRVKPTLTARAPGRAIEALQVEHDVRLVTEPDGLRPHALEVARRILVRTGGIAGPEDLLSLDDRRTWTFRYPPPEPEEDD